MTPPPYRIAPSTPNEAYALAQKRARISVLISVGMIGGAYLLWLPILGQVWLVDIIVLAVPFVRALGLLGKPRGDVVLLLFLWAFFGPLAIIHGVGKLEDAYDAKFSIQQTVCAMAIAALVPVVVLHRTEFRRLRRLAPRQDTPEAPPPGAAP